MVKAEAERVLREGLGGPHIFNLGHGVMRQTDPERVAQLVEVVRAFDRTQAEVEVEAGQRV